MLRVLIGWCLLLVVLFIVPPLDTPYHHAQRLGPASAYACLVTRPGGPVIAVHAPIIVHEDGAGGDDGTGGGEDGGGSGGGGDSGCAIPGH